MEIRALTPAEQKYTYAQSMQLEGQTSNIGHLRGDFASSGYGFYTTWFDTRPQWKTDEFKKELDEVINSLREDKGLLHNRYDMSAFAKHYPESAFAGSYCTEYGFRVDTEKHAFLFRCNPTKGDYNFYCYCFVKEWLDKHMVNSRSRCYAKEVIFMVAGHLQEKKGYFYMVLSYPDAAGKRKTKWLPTGLPVKGNKKKAEKMLMETRQTFVPECKPIQEDMLFSDFLLQWLEIAKPTIALTTYSSYSGMAKSVIIPYFKERKITLSEIKATDIQAFYMKQLKRVKANTVIHYHSVIHRALKYAVKIDLISVNPADKVERPKADKFIGSFYDSNEVQALFEAAKGTLIEIPIFLGAFYGLRRSEALGLKWDAIDFQNNTITIRHTVTSCNLDGKHIQIAQDTTKTKSSMRTLPLVPAFKEKLLKLKEQQEEYRRVCGRCYNKKYLEYICVDEMGTLISPHYLTASFPKLLEKNNLRHIRFHDLRHSCASLLLANGVPMKQIQEWLGHSDFSTTANVYAHLDYNSKLSSADAMVNGLSGALEVIS